MKPSIPSRHQRGAALVEFILGAAFVLVPLHLAVQALGKFADVQNTAQAAARYAAWEKTVWFEDGGSTFNRINEPNRKSAAEIRNEMLVRIVNDRRDGLRYSASDRHAQTYAHGIDPLWHDSGDGAFVDSAALLTQTSHHTTPDNDFVGKILRAFRELPFQEVLGSPVPPVPTDTLATTKVRLAKVAAASPIYRRLWSRAHALPEDWAGLDFDAQSAVLSNSWGANSSRGTKAMVAESVPTAKLLGDAVQAGAIVTLGLWDPTLAPRLDMGKIAPDVVPSDRLK